MPDRFFLQRHHKALEERNNNIVPRVNPEVAKVLKSDHNRFLQGD